MRFANRWALALLVSGVLAALCWAASPAPNDEKAGLVVHEWGTFSTFSGSNGVSLEFSPYDNDLPDFVHGYLPHNSKAGPQWGSISLETPVLYFYNERPLTASVQVGFPRGTLTEWYPQASRSPTKLVWDGIKVQPHGDARLLVEKKESRYYAARETDAAPLSVTFFQDNKDQTEQEKFLFYRGVGSFAMPLTVKAQAGGSFRVYWDGKAPAGELVLLQVRSKAVRFQPFALKPGPDDRLGAKVQVPDRDSTKEELGATITKLLIGQGLYEKEARAMVKTWSSAWFEEEGTRVLYLLPSSTTDELLPLKIEPKPAKTLRVLVGRHDVLTPEHEKQIDALVATLKARNGEANAEQRRASEEMWKLGRYRDAAYHAAELRLEQRH